MNKIIPGNKARQGRWGRHTFVVLNASLILIALGWVAVEYYGKAIEPSAEKSQANQR